MKQTWNDESIYSIHEFVIYADCELRSSLRSKRSVRWLARSTLKHTSNWHSPFDHSIISRLLSVNILVSWYKNSGTVFGLETAGITTPVDGVLSWLRTKPMDAGIVTPAEGARFVIDLTIDWSDEIFGPKFCMFRLSFCKDTAVSIEEVEEETETGLESRYCSFPVVSTIRF